MTSKLGIMADWAYETRSKINSTFTDMGEAKKLKSTIVKETKSLNLTWHSFYA